MTGGHAGRSPLDDVTVAEASRPVAVQPDDTRLGRYLVIELIGAGGMGRVLRAYDPELRREVALKQLIARNRDAQGTRRIVREAQTMARLRHHNLVPVYDVGQSGDDVFIAMEYVEGTTLRAWLDIEPRSWQAIVEAFVGAGRGLAAAHAAGVIHRDFKPANVMVGARGRSEATRDTVRVVDFGLANALPHERSHGATPSQGEDFDPGGLTQPGVVLGTPLYMAPEQHFGGAVGPHSDQYAFCVALYEALYATRPFDGKDLQSLVASKLAGGPNPPRAGSRAVPRWLQRATLRGLAPDAAQRWPSMDALVAELERGQGRVRRRRIFAGVAAGALIAGGLALAVAVDDYRREAACERDGASIDAVWNPERSARLRDALTGTGLAYAEQTADKLMPWLDDHAGAWHRARAEACLDATVRGQWSAETLDRSLWCLDERRDQLDALVGQLLRADESGVEAAIGAAARLGRIDECRNTGWLQRMQPPPQAQRDEIRGAQAELARAVALERAGRYAEGLALARGTRERAQTLAWPPLSAAARTLEAALLAREGEGREAARAGKLAYFEASSFGEWSVAADAATRLVLIVGEHEGRREEGLEWGEHARMALAHALDPDGLREAERLSGLATVQRLRGANDVAQALHERALQLREAALGPDHPDVAASLASLANVFRAVQDYPRARALHERALAIRERALGPAHPSVASSLSNLGVVLAETGDHVHARADFERSLAIREAVHGPWHATLLSTLNNLAAACASGGDTAAAQAYFERALAIVEASRGERHPDVAAALVNVAKVNNSVGRQDRARALYGRAIAIQEATLGPDDLMLAVSLAGLARVDALTGDAAAAARSLERAVAIYERRDGTQDGELDARFALAKALLGSGGDRSRARALAEQARDGWRVGATPRAAEVDAWLRAEHLEDLASPPQ
ncbi:MAG: serine/threonine-protein kinase [Nannocystaceae bacterium]|nr:serine/threonine-protein kinase [Nannocystaceae bacterium]